jgi:glycosyltransferase involved in cell wall biosynthesis
VKRILFISHDASLTGAPILMLNLMQCLRKGGFVCDRIVVRKKNGALLNEFEKEADILYFDNNQAERLYKKILRKVGWKGKNVNQELIQQWINDSDIVVSNTITNGSLLKEFSFKNKILISYVHELQMSSETFTNENERGFVLEKTNVYGVPSNTVKEFLETEYSINPKRIGKLNYYIPNLHDCDSIATNPDSSTFKVGIIGTLDWRKGAEVLPVIVLDYFNKYTSSKVVFVLMGADQYSDYYKILINYLKKINHLDKVVFKHASRNVKDFYQSIDVLLLCSKEDPYPLVVLEAASLNKPCICFSDAGGAPEFVQNDAGSSVPYLDINKLNNVIYEYYSNKNLCIIKGNIAYRRFMEEHNNEKLVLQQFNELLLLNTNE